MNIRRVWSNVSHSLHRSDSHGLNDLLEESEKGGLVGGDEEESHNQIGKQKMLEILSVYQ